MILPQRLQPIRIDVFKTQISYFKVELIEWWRMFLYLGLLQPVPEGDYEALVAVMGYLMHVKDRAVTTDDMFQPLTETIELLKFYDMDIPEEVNVLLQVKFITKF